jgi:hydrogenase expression/formation protein HypD
LKFITEFRNSEIAKGLIASIRKNSKHKVRFMEFCGGHTVSIFKHGIRHLLPPTIEMISGPGCPVCVTATADIDKAIAVAFIPGVIITSFGDMLRVPGSRSSLQKTRAEGADVRTVYSTLDALQIAKENPSKTVAFIGVGFETTAPTIAASVLQASEQSHKNHSGCR